MVSNMLSVIDGRMNATHVVMELKKEKTNTYKYIRMHGIHTYVPTYMGSGSYVRFGPVHGFVRPIEVARGLGVSVRHCLCFECHQHDRPRRVVKV